MTTDINAIAIIISGIVLGVSGGLSPGPLTALVISQSLAHGIREGIKVAIAPLITDAPIIVCSFLLISSLDKARWILGGLSICGGIYLAHLAIINITSTGIYLESEKIQPKSIKKGIIANFLNPAPYVFWMTVGSPILIKALDAGLIFAFFFLFCFYFFLVGLKILMAVIFGKSRSFLESRKYIFIIKSLGVMLLLFSLYYFWNGLVKFGVLSW